MCPRVELFSSNVKFALNKSPIVGTRDTQKNMTLRQTTESLLNVLDGNRSIPPHKREEVLLDMIDFYSKSSDENVDWVNGEYIKHRARLATILGVELRDKIFGTDVQVMSTLGIDK